MFKLKNNYCPHPIMTVETVSSVTASTTKQHDCLCVARVHTQSGGRSLAIRGPSLRNTLPQHEQEAPNIHTFKSKLRHYLLTN